MTAYKLLQKYLCLRKRLRRLKERVAALEPAFSPVQLFAAGEQGAWYDPSDLTTLFQDSAGTIPVTTAGQPVGRMLDKSGRGNHATQATSAARPTYQTSGGLHWLVFDGVDDVMVAPNHPFSFTGPVSAFIAFSKSSSTTYSTLFSAGAIGNATLNVSNTMAFQPIDVGWSTDVYYPAGVRAGPSIYLGSPYVGVFNIQNWSLHKISGTQGKINSVSYTPTAYGAASPAALNSGPMRIGSFDPVVLANGAYAGKMFGMVVRGVASTATEISNTEAFLNNKAGVVI